MKFRLFASLFAGSCLLALAAPARAHTQMTSPMPREEDAAGDIKMGPCGTDPKPAMAPAANVFAPGSSLKVDWTEVVGHPGWWRIALDPNGQSGFVDPTQADYNAFVANPANNNLTPNATTRMVGSVWILSDYLDKHANGVSGTKWTTMVTLPNVTCDRCTLQLIQVMADSAHPYPNSRYYHCADLALANGSASRDAGAMDSGGRSDAAPGGHGGATAQGGAGGSIVSGTGGGSAGAGAGTGGGGQGAGGASGASGSDGTAGDNGSGGAAGSGTGGGAASHGGGCSFAASTPNFGGAGVLVLATLLRLNRARRRRKTAARAR